MFTSRGLAHNVASHAHNVASHAHNVASHAHNVASYAHNVVSHAHNVASHAHNVASHAHNLVSCSQSRLVSPNSIWRDETRRDCEREIKTLAAQARKSDFFLRIPAT